MREHKYRFYYKGKLLEELTLKEIAGKCEFHWADDVDIAEFTGLHDKNGVEIFEGDKVRNWWWGVNNKFIGYNWVVKFGEYDDSEIDYGSVGIGFYCENEVGEQESPINLPEDKGIEVIGSIYSNPELIKKEGN